MPRRQWGLGTGDAVGSVGTVCEPLLPRTDSAGSKKLRFGRAVAMGLRTAFLRSFDGGGHTEYVSSSFCHEERWCAARLDEEAEGGLSEVGATDGRVVGLPIALNFSAVKGSVSFGSGFTGKGSTL